MRRWLLQAFECKVGPLGIHPFVKPTEERNMNGGSSFGEMCLRTDV